MNGSILFLSSFLLNRYAFSCTCDYAPRLMWVAWVCLAIVRVKGVYCVLYVVCHLTGLASRVAWGSIRITLLYCYHCPYHPLLYTPYTTYFISQYCQPSIYCQQWHPFSKYPTSACVEHHTTQPIPNDGTRPLPRLPISTPLFLFLRSPSSNIKLILSIRFRFWIRINQYQYQKEWHNPNK